MIDHEALARKLYCNTEWAGECLEWQGFCNTARRGHAAIWVDELRRPVHAHRVSYILSFGDIPDGLIVRHKCDNPKCVRPRHLELGTHADNTRDKMERGRHSFGEKSGNARLTEAQVWDILRSWHSGEANQYDLALKYGVRQSAISRICQGARWSHIHKEFMNKLRGEQTWTGTGPSSS